MHVPTVSRLANAVRQLLSALAGVTVHPLGGNSAPALPNGTCGPRGGGRALVVAASVLVALALSAPAALAAFGPPHSLVTSFDGTGSTAGAFSNVNRDAVNESTGNVYVFDNGTSALSQFDANGAPVAFSDPGLLGASSITLDISGSDGDVSVDNSGDTTNGNIYVLLENAPNTVYGFDPSGAPLPGFPLSIAGDVCGVGVDPDGDVWVASYSAGLLTEYAPDGSPLSGSLAIGQSCHFAFDGSGNVYVASYQGAVTKYVPNGSGGFFGTGVIDSGVAQDVATDWVTGNVFVGHSSTVDEYASDGGALGSFGSPALGSAVGVAVNGATGKVYVSDAAANVVHIFDSTPVLDVAAAAPTSVGASGVTLNGTVTPVGLQVTDCRFEYGPTTAYGQTVPCTPDAAAIGSGTSPVDVSAVLSGLPEDWTVHYRLVATDAGTTSATPDRVVGVPQIRALGVTAVEKHTAGLKAGVNPHASATTCQVEYVAEADYDPEAVNPFAAATVTDCQPAAVGNGSGYVPITADLTGLLPSTVYHMRVVAINAAGTERSTEQKLTTDPAARISELTASDTSATTAEVSALINPLGEATTYHFEYGTTTAYGTSVPATPDSIGSGSADVFVAAQFTGLTPGTTYHVRLVAENASGVVRSGDRRFGHYSGSTALPDGRAYEQVTPADKNGSVFDSGVFLAPSRVAASGNSVQTASIQCLAGAEACSAERGGREGTLFSSNRTPHGWLTKQLTPSATQFAESKTMDQESDTNKAVFSSSGLPDNKDQILSRESDGTLTVVGPAQAPTAVGNGPLTTVHMSLDGSRTFVNEPAGILGWSFDSTTPTGATLVEYIGRNNSAPILVAVSGGSGSTDVISECGALLGNGSALEGAISDDGRRVFFTALGSPPCAAGLAAPAEDELYARIDESHGVKISDRSPTDCTTPACQSSAQKKAEFESASDDGMKVIFRSQQQLTDPATQGAQNLYFYDFDQPAGHELTAISAGALGGDGPGVETVLAVSNDGSHVYFVATGALKGQRSSSGESPTPGANNLYVYERDSSHPSGRRTFITELPAVDGDGSLWGGGYRPQDRANVTPDGRFLVFPSHGNLTPTETNAIGSMQIFRYDSATKELLRVSVGEGGFNNDGTGTGAPGCPSPFDSSCTTDAVVPSSRAQGARRGPAVSYDGSYVFFTSPAALTLGADDYVPSGADLTPGVPYYRQNVYEWHDGHVSLIAEGRGSKPNQLGLGRNTLIGADATGANVFFKSHSALSSADADGGQLDIYDARVCTTADPCITPPPSVTACSGDACQGPASGAPALPLAATINFAGAGNPPTAVRPKAGGISVLSRLVRGSRFIVRVRVPGKGRLRLSGALIATVRRAAARAGTVAVPVALTKKARRALTRKRRLRVPIRVSYTPANGSAVTRKVTLTVSGARKAGGSAARDRQRSLQVGGTR
jgi:hypothetical protein